MPTYLTKRLLWALLILLIFIILGLLSMGAARLIAYFQRGADPSTALNIIPSTPLPVKVNWLPDDPDTGRRMEPYTRLDIEASYIRAWHQWNISYLKKQPYALQTYFVGPAEEAIRASVLDAAQQGLQVYQVNTLHNLKLHFYSADGAIVSFTDHDAIIAQIIRDESGKPIFAGETRATFDVVMFLKDGNWRVRHWVRVRGEVLDDPLPPVETLAGFVRTRGVDLTLGGEPFYIRGINYYPQDTPWDRFWPNYDPLTTEKDFALIRSMGLNTVRIFIPYEQFGGARVEPAMLERLADLLLRAERNDLKVIVTLFDFRTDYKPILWPEADRHLETLLTRFAEEPAILAWDLKNEPDRDYSTNGNDMVDTWLAHTARFARQFDPHHLITIGWSSATAATQLTENVDFISFHHFQKAEELATLYPTLRQVITEKPLLLAEFGLSSWFSLMYPFAPTENDQAVYYTDILNIINTTDDAGYLAWTLYDFSYVPSIVAGRLPWQIEKQKHFGVIRLDGEPKPAASLLAPAPSESRFNPSRLAFTP